MLTPYRTHQQRADDRVRNGTPLRPDWGPPMPAAPIIDEAPLPTRSFARLMAHAEAAAADAKRYRQDPNGLDMARLRMVDHDYLIAMIGRLRRELLQSPA